MLERPGTAIGPYKLLEQIGEGGFGVVFMAEQQHPVRRKVALKVLKPGMDTRQVVARFEAERQALALMDHPNIARVLDAGQTAGARPYFVMDLVKGIPITEYCDRNLLAPQERLELFAQVCGAIQHAHQKGIIHRDIKPSNVLVTLHDGAALVKVIDFGVAKALGHQLTDKTLFTGFAQMIGTPLYMSPEQAALSNVDVDTRSDIYSLGVLLYELLTGTTPFDKQRLKSAAFEEIRRIIREDEPPRPSTRLSDLGRSALQHGKSPAGQTGSNTSLAAIAALRKTEPRKLRQLVRGELDWIVMKCLEKDRNRRYETANSLALDVQRYLHDEPVLACPPSAAYRLRKFVRRNRTPLAVAALFLFFMALLGAGGGWLLGERADQEQRITSERLKREAALDKEVDRALQEADGLRAQGKWPEALAAVERADQLLASAGRAERPARLLDLHQELQLARRLEDIHQGAQSQKTSLPAARGAKGIAGDRGPRHSAEEEFFRGRDQDRQFASEFRDFGIDIDALAPAEAAARISRTGIRPAIVQALDEWAAMRKRNRGDKDPGWKKLLEVSRLADADDWRNRCREALEKRDRQSLERLAQSIPIQEAPPATVYLLGHALMDLGSVERAAEVLRAGQQRHPDDFWLNDALGWLSTAFVRPPRYDDALRYYAAALAVRPRSVPAHRSVGNTLLAKGALDEAIAHYFRMIELDPQDATGHTNLGIALQWKGNLDGAIAQYQEAMHLQPQFMRAHFDLGTALYHARKLDEAIVEFRAAIHIQPDFASAHDWVGSALDDAGKHDEAISEYREAIRLKPDLDDVYYNLGRCLLRVGRPEEAVAELQKAIGVQPKNVWARVGLGRVLADTGKLDEAIASFLEAIRIDPSFAFAHEELERVLSQRVNPQVAIATYYKVIELAPQRAQVHNGLAWALTMCPDIELRDPLEAVKFAKRAVELAGNEAYCWNTLGVAQYRAGDWNAAIEALKKSVEIHGGDAFDWYFLAMAHGRLGQMDDARKLREQAVVWVANNGPVLEGYPHWPEELRRLRLEAEELLGKLQP